MHKSKLFWYLIFLALTVPATLFATPVKTGQALVMGIFPRHNAESTIRQFNPLANYLSNKLGRTVRIETSRDFKSFWHGVSQQRYDIVHYNQYHYVQSKKEFGYEVILKNAEFGKATLAGAIAVRKDSNINTLAELKGKKIMFGGGRKAMIAYIVPAYLLQQAGLDKDDYETVFAKTPANAMIGAYLNQASASGSGDIIFNIPIIKKRINTTKMKFIAQSEQLPHLPWALKGTMQDKLKEKIQQLMSGLHLHHEGLNILNTARLTRLHIATDDEYNVIRTIIKKVTGAQF